MLIKPKITEFVAKLKLKPARTLSSGDSFFLSDRLLLAGRMNARQIITAKKTHGGRCNKPD